MLSQNTHFESGDPVFAVDREGVIVLWNQAAESTFGYAAADALGNSCWKLLRGYDVHDNQYCHKRCAVRDMALRHRLVNGFKVSYKTATNERKRFEVSCLTVFDDPGDELLLHLCRPEGRGLARHEAKTGSAPSAESGNNRQYEALSRRELEALALLADGRNNHEIAEAMSISVPTVRNHIQHVLHKLEVHSRLEAVVAARQLQLI